MNDELGSDIAKQILTHLGADIVIGKSGNDVITLADLATGDEYTGTVLAMGQEGDDIYTIGSENAQKLADSSIEIYDHEGTNTIKLKSDTYKSGNICIYANVVLKKDGEGNYIQDAHGNYEYEIKNFGTTTEDIASIGLQNTPFKDGDTGYAVLIADNTKNRETLNSPTIYYNQNGVKLESETYNTIDYIYSSDGKYVKKTQLDATFKNTANWLANNGYNS